MRQVWVTGPGGPEVLEVRELPDPHPGPGGGADLGPTAGVSFAVVLARSGLYPDAPKPPTVLGYDVAGEIDEVGTDVKGLTEGDRVLALTRFGGYSSTVVVPVHRVKVVPPGKDLRQAAGLPVIYLTAYLTLNRLGSVRPGDWVLIHAAAGGVGLSALQLSTWLGAVTVGTASAGKHERLRQLGLDYPIDYRNQDFEAEVMRITAGRGVDMILDAVGGTTTRKNYRCLLRSASWSSSGYPPGAHVLGAPRGEPFPRQWPPRRSSPTAAPERQQGSARIQPGPDGCSYWPDSGRARVRNRFPSLIIRLRRQRSSRMASVSARARGSVDPICPQSAARLSGRSLQAP